MNDKKNIDRLFQEKFKDFETAPSDAVWNRIQESLPKKKKKRRVIPLWWQIGGVAAAIALLLTVGVSVFNADETNSETFPIVNTDTSDDAFKGTNPKSENNNTTPSSDKNQNINHSIADDQTEVVDSELKTTVDDIENSTSNKKQPSNQLVVPNHSKQKPNTLVTTSNKVRKNNTSQKPKHVITVLDNEKKARIATETNTSNTTLNSDTDKKTQLKSETERKSVLEKSIEQHKTAVAENSSSKNIDTETVASDENKTDNSKEETSIIEDPKQPSIEDAIAAANNIINEEEKEDEQGRWSIAPNVAPVYFSSLGQGSSLDQQFNDNTKSADINMSYGISGSYAISKKLKVRAGINRVNLNQNTADVFAFSGAETAARGVSAAFSNISFKGGEQHVSLMNSNLMNRSSVPELFNTKIAGTIDQQFGFIEVPLELEYKVIDKKFGVNVIGGFSTFILNENEIYADVNGSSTLIGEANNINDTSFSANFGLGVDYNLSKQWNINLEPTFKYQINTFNNTTGDFRPFFIGVYTGLSYKF